MSEERVKPCPYCHGTISFEAAICPVCKKEMPKKILVVENTKRSPEWILTRVGGVDIEVEKTTTGREAIRKAGEKAYVAVLIDLKLPDMKGEDVAKTLVSMGIKAPLIGSFQGKPIPDLAELSKSGFVNIMKKPLNKEKLKKTLMMAMAIFP